MEVFIQRLRNEFEMDVVVTTPSVPYQVQIWVESIVRLLYLLLFVDKIP